MRRRAAILALASIAVVAILGSAQPSGAAGTPAPSGVTGIALASSVQLAWQPVAGASGYTVYTAGTAAAAVAAVLTTRPDVLVLEVNLPDDTGGVAYPAANLPVGNSTDEVTERRTAVAHMKRQVSHPLVKNSPIGVDAVHPLDVAAPVDDC